MSIYNRFPDLPSHELQGIPEHCKFSRRHKIERQCGCATWTSTKCGGL